MNLLKNQTRPASCPKIFSLLLAATLALSACVTVNVNFPEGAVQKATDDFVKDLYRARDRGAKPDVAPAPSTSAPTSAIDFLIPSAMADDSFVVKTPAALAIRDKMSAMVNEVLTHKRSGALGETNDGLLVIHQPDQVKKLQVARVKQVVETENANRIALYSEVLAANGLKPARLKDVRVSFARSFQAESPSGTWLQEADGKWSQKK